MSLSMPFREFSRLKLVASVTLEGNTTMKFEPSPVSLVEDDVCPNVVFHFHSSLCNGINTLTVYVSSTGSTPPLEAGNIIQDCPDPAHLASSSGGECLETLDPSLGWMGDMSNSNPLLDQFRNSSFQQGTPPNVSFSSVSRQESDQRYSDLIPEYGDNTSIDALASAYPAWNDPAIFSAIPFPDYTPSLLSSASSSLPTTPSVSSTTSPASNYSEIPMDETSSASSPEASASYNYSQLHLSAVPRRVASSSSKLAHRHRDVSHSRSRPRPSSYPDHLGRVQPKSSFPCTFVPCPEVFSRKHDRMRHEVAQHGLQCRWVCDRCRKFFSSEKTLAKHKCNVNSDVRWTAPTQTTGQDGGGPASI